MTNHNAMKLLGLIAILCMVPFGAKAFGAITSDVTIDSIIVSTGPDSIALVCTDPTYDAGELIVGRQLLVDNNGDFLSPEITVGGPVDTVSLVCDGITANSIDFSSASYIDFASINVELRVFADSGPDSVDTAIFSVGDDTKPTVNAPATPSTELTNSDTFVESTCTVTDNDPLYGTQACIITGSIDTSILGLQSVDFDGANDAAGNTPDTVTRSVTMVDTTNPVLTPDQASPIDIVKNVGPIPTLTATVSDNDNTANGDTVSCDTSAVILGTIGSYIATCDFVDPSGNAATQITYTVNVVAGNSPVITLLGSNPQSVNLHDPYVEAGATAADTEDGDITGSIITGSSAVDVDTLGSYIVTYDVTDSSGNTDHEERTVNVITGDAPIITILGDNPANIDYGTNYFDAGATASDTEDGDITGSIIIGSSIIDTTAGGYSATIYTVTYDVTDSNGNTAHAERTVNVAGRISHGDYCSGDCIPPTIGLDSNGRRMVEWPVMYETGTVSFKQLAEYFHTPMSDFTVNVGDTNTLRFVIYENSGYDAIRQIGLSIGVPFSGTFNDGAATLRWFSAPMGQTVEKGSEYIEETDKDNVFELKSFTTEKLECSPTKTGNNNCMGVTIKYVFREAPKDTAVRLDLWDEKRNAFQHVLNEGVTVIGESLNGPDVFTAMANDGRMYTLTTDNESATDQNGDRWSLVDSFWAKDLKPVINETAEQRILELEQAESRATQMFDSAPFQKVLKPAKGIEYPDYPRLHDSEPNMNKALIDYVLSRANHS